MEYMASGTPLVAFDLPCIPEEYKSYFYMIPEYTKDSIKSFLEEILMLDASELHKFGIKAQEWIDNKRN
jgi:glycosyltransferase involved in cell wall biosynthesis